MQFWQTAALRRSNLSPGEVAAGLVLANVLPYTQIVLLKVSVGTHRFEFEFTQRTIEADTAKGVRIRRGPDGTFERFSGVPWPCRFAHIAFCSRPRLT